MRLEDKFCPFARPDLRIRRSDLEKEVTEAYHGHLQAEALKYGCDEDQLDRVLGGPGRFTAIAHCYYDYAVEGQLNANGIGLQDHDWLDFASFINQARWDDELHAVNSMSIKLEQVFKLAAVRSRLDCDIHGDVAYNALPEVLHNTAVGYLTLSDIAFLAGMTEKAVRNAAQPKVEDRLVTRKEGSRTVVDSHEALRWLNGRRNFVATQIV
ncbi:TPA: hypothetical protein ACHQNF_002305 [Pseudomonas aeruginosa]